jgi:hypothetical protein
MESTKEKYFVVYLDCFGFESFDTREGAETYITEFASDAIVTVVKGRELVLRKCIIEEVE